ncbi:MAG: beta-lactamase family protein [Deltaproteobacteria bacterium]|nr:beta-lactamase family protein [Deltaproteobacteria bacterium]
MRSWVWLAMLLVACSRGESDESKPAPEPKPPVAAATDAAPGPVAVTSLAALAEPGVGKKWIRGAALAVIRPGREPELAFVGDDGRGKPLTAETRFAIGSVTKVFTSLLLADASLRGEVGLDEAASKAGKLRLPSREGKRLTLRQLSQHTSGLPRLPPLKPKSFSQPYQGYGEKELWPYLAELELERAPGAAEEYSNLGATVLGMALARRAGTDYDALVRERLLKPMALASTTMGPPTGQGLHLALGSNSRLDTTENWDLGIFAPAGAIWSSLGDMIKFAQLNLAPSGPGEKILELAQKERLGWQRRKDGVLWHNGETAGFHSFVAVDRKGGYAVVVLANTASQTVDLLGFAALDYARIQTSTFTWPEP